MLKKIFAIAIVALTVAGCSTFQKVVDVAGATVPAAVVIPAANAFDILKAGATSYGAYCINQRKKVGSWPAICSADTRRIVIKTVRSGTAARNQLEMTIETGTPAAASVYNVMIAAIDGVKTTPAADPQFGGK